MLLTVTMILGAVLGVLAAVKAYQLRPLEWLAMEFFFYMLSALGWFVAFAAMGFLWF
jgi:hypothetical protein